MLLKDYPGMTQALKRAGQIEDTLRSRAMLPVDDEICGVIVQQLRLPHLDLLLAARSPFLTDGSRMAEDCALFLWIVSPQYRADMVGREEFIKSIAHQPYNRIARGIDNYLDRAMMDRPQGGGGRKLPVTFSAWMRHVFAFSYHWTPETTNAQPIAALYQYLVCIGAENNPKAPLRSPKVDAARLRIVRKRLNGDRR